MNPVSPTSPLVRSLRLRLLTALVAIPALLAIIWAGEPYFSLTVGALAILGLNEFYTLIGQRWGKPFLFVGTAGVVAFVLNADLSGDDTIAFIVIAVPVIALVSLAVHPKYPKRLVLWLWTIAGVFFIGCSLSYFILLRDLEYGKEWVVLVLFSTFATDAGAYFVGRGIGRHLLAPKISPRKTWEGVIGGILAALLVSYLVYLVLDHPIGLPELFGLGAIIAVVSQIGDLLESYLKRIVGVKEAGSLVPGHGGLLDRLDSVVLTIVVVYYYLQWAMA